MTAAFGDATRHWLARAFSGPTPVQERGWERISAGLHTLLVAPTGSGKTLAAFLWSIDRLMHSPPPDRPGVRILYVSPMKALGYDVERNLALPLAGVEAAAAELGAPVRPLRVGVRTGDTLAVERARQRRRPPDLLITTPESLFLMLSSGAREGLRTVETVILDEVHAILGTKRGVHLALSLERLARLTERDPQRVGLSATLRPLEEAAGFLGGDRPVAVVDTSARPRLELIVGGPPPPPPAPPVLADRGFRVAMMGLDPSPFWEAILPVLRRLLHEHRSTLIFVNSRRLAERLAAWLTEAEAQAGGDLRVAAHHGSLSRRQREGIEADLKAGRLRGLVATSTLELGIDIAAVDLVVQLGSPGGVARGLQRVGRAGHGVGQTSRGRIYARHPGELLECAVVAQGMRHGDVEPMATPQRALDVLAQQVIGALIGGPMQAEALLALARRSWPYRDLSRAGLDAVLSLLSGGRAGELAEERALAALRPRLNWDRARDRVEARPGVAAVLYANAGTIPDRGLFRVRIGEGGPRVGELDEEMVYETSVGDVIVLGASSWRVEAITPDEVRVAPAPGVAGRMPFWKGEGPGRPIPLGRAMGALARRLEALGPAAEAALVAEDLLDGRAAAEAVAWLAEQRAATGALPTDRRIVVERFRDELGDWRVCLLSPFGARVHGPWALAVQAATARRGGAVQALWSDDGAVFRFADADQPPDPALLLPEAEDLEATVVGQLGRTPMFSALFRECAARALLLTRKRAGARSPLWAQRRRAEDLLAAVKDQPDFPVTLEAAREALLDFFDLPALAELLRGVEAGQVEVLHVETAKASPMARPLAAAVTSANLYAEDAPLAERRAAALNLDLSLLRELMGEAAMQDLLDPEVVAEVAAELQGLAPRWQARDADGLHDLLRRVGDLDAAEIAARCAGDGAAWLDHLVLMGRLVPLGASPGRLIAVEDAARYRDGLGRALPPGVPEALAGPVPEALDGLLLRYARTHAPFTAAEVAERFGLPVAATRPLLLALERQGALARGPLRPGAPVEVFCEVALLRVLRRRTLARLSAAIAPVPPIQLARALPRWHGLGESGGDRLGAAVAQLEGCPLNFQVLEGEILPARVPRYRPDRLDTLGALGSVVWIGAGGDPPRVMLVRRERVPLLLAPPEPPAELRPEARALLELLLARGASFGVELQSALGLGREDLEQALWALADAGLISNDTFQPLRVRGRARAGAGGRWFALSRLFAGTSPDPAARARAWAELLLQRHGLLSRGLVAADPGPLGPGPVWRALRELEAIGRVRRGYFVDGIGGRQFAAAGAVEAIRAAGAAGARLISAIDPANPYGLALPWPARDGRRPARVAGAAVVLVDGLPVLYLERGGKGLLSLPAAEEPAALAAAAAALAGRRGLRLLRIDGEPARGSALAPALIGAGFVADHRGLIRL